MSMKLECQQYLPQIRRSQIRDRSQRNRCFGLQIGGMQMPTLRGIKAVAMNSDRPVEVASDWVDTDSADEVRISASAGSMEAS